MEKSTKVIIYSAFIVAIMAIIVFTTGNSSQQSQQMMNSTSTQNASNLGNATANATISLQDLASHNSKADCWVGYNKSVYDLTAWLPKHPGSSAAIEPYCGTAVEFEAAFKGQHGTSQVRTLLRESIYKGELA